MTDAFVTARLYIDTRGMPDPTPTLRALLDDLRPAARNENADDTETKGDSATVALVRSGDGIFDLVARDADKTELARVALGMVRNAPVHSIGWLDPDMIVDRETFLNVLDPAPAAPAAPRPARVVALPTGARTPRPARRAALRMDPDRRLQLADQLIRHGMIAPAAADEVKTLRRELGLGSPERRAACHALITTSTLVALNATQAAASALSMF